MKIFRTLGLLVVLIALSAYVYFYEIKGGEERDKQKALDEKIFAFENDSVNIVEIRSIFNNFRFERNGPDWKITEPVETDGENTTINSMLTSLGSVKKSREFTIKDGEQTDYGLVARSVLAIVQLKNGQRDSLRFGDNTPVGTSNYAGRGDTLVYTVDQASKKALEKQLFDWRDKSIAKIEQNDVVELNLKNTNGSFSFVKEGSDWYLTQPRRVLAENQTVNTILRKIQNDKVISIASENLDSPGEYRLKKPAYVLDLYIGAGKAHKQIMFSSLKSNTAHGKDSGRPQVFSVDSTFIKELDKSFFDLRDKKIVSSFTRDQIDSIIIQQGDSLVTFARDSSNTWSLVGDTSKVKEWKINSLLSNLTNLKATKFISENTASTRKFGLDKPARILRLFSAGKQQIEVHFVSPKSAQFIAFCPDSKILAEVGETAYDNSEVKIKDYIESGTGN